MSVVFISLSSVLNSDTLPSSIQVRLNANDSIVESVAACGYVGCLIHRFVCVFVYAGGV